MMQLSSHLWQSNRDLIRASLEHPFVRGIATGTLERDRFAFYVGQDAFFLKSFARAYSIAAAKAPDWESFEQFHQFAGGVLEELRLHDSYAEKWGVNLHDVTPAAATRRYTDFLLATAWSSDVGLTAIAMCPCMRLYAYLGQQLAAESPPPSDYSHWIETYSDRAFEELAQRLEATLDRHATPSPAAESAYRYALECERDFFTEAWNSSAIRSRSRP